MGSVSLKGRFDLTEMQANERGIQLGHGAFVNHYTTHRSPCKRPRIARSGDGCDGSIPSALELAVVEAQFVIFQRGGTHALVEVSRRSIRQFNAARRMDQGRREGEDVGFHVHGWMVHLILHKVSSS